MVIRTNEGVVFGPVSAFSVPTRHCNKTRRQVLLTHLIEYLYICYIFPSSLKYVQIRTGFTFWERGGVGGLLTPVWHSPASSYT